MSIVHNTSVDFTRRVISEPVHIVQGDRTLPTLAVELLSDGQPYTVPDGAQVNIALDKKDGTFVLNKADSVDGNIATFTITAQMAAVAGDFSPEVQIVNGAGQATTGKFPYIVDKAEIQEGMIESTSEGTALIAYVSRAEEAAEKAEKVQSQIDSVTVNTEAAAKSAKEAAESAIVSATNADLAKASATAAKTSETAAKAHLESVQEEHSDITSEISAANTAIRASVTEAKDYSIVSRSYAEGGTGTRDGEDTANARYYMEQAQKIALGNLDDKMSDTSENAVKNMVIKAYVDSHVPDLSDATTEASGLMSAEDKAKLDGIAEGATKDDLTPYAKTADVNTSLDGKQDKGDYATADDLAKKGDTLSYADSTLKLLSGETVLSEVPVEAVAPYERKDITSRIGELSAAIASGNPEKYDFREGYYFTGASGYEYILSSYCHFHGQVNNYAVIKDRHWGVIVNTKKTHAWNSSGKTTGGYSASELDAYLQDEVLTNVKSDLTALFGDDWSNHLIANNKVLSNAVDETHYNRFGTASGAASSWTWFKGRYIVAPSEIEIYGSIAWSSSGYDTGEACHPLQAFQRFRFSELLGNTYSWLRDVASASDACDLRYAGLAAGDPASETFGVLGLIAIK